MGVAPFVKIGSSVIFDPGKYTNPNQIDLESRSYLAGARISSNSWGSNSDAYTVDSQNYDKVVRDAQSATSANPLAGNQEMVVVFAAGNNGSGANTVGSPSTAKNVITAGASENVQAFGGPDGCGIADTGADNANDIISFSSRGPTSDGRKKPDLTAPGTHVSGGVWQNTLVNPVSGNGVANPAFDASGVCAGVGAPPGGNFFPSGQQWYTASSGTSHSTPAIAGASALIRQFFITNLGGPPSPAMTKATLMNSARYMTGVGANDNLYSNSQGMGEVNLDGFFGLFTASHVFRDQVPADKFTASGQQRLYVGNISDSTKPFRVTLAYTDAPGPTSGSAFVNNLDLEVIAGGNTYKGNVFTGANSATGGVADTRNNVESVFVPAGVTGTFIVKVKGTNIAGDGVPGDADMLDQDFAIVIFNGVEAPVAVVSSSSKAITAESCAPSNNAVDPSETVTVNLGLANMGTANTTNLVATLQATGGVTSPSGPQNYGALTTGDPEVVRAFTFTVSATCGQVVTATLQLQDGATDLGTATYTFQVGILGAAQPAVSYSTGNIATSIPDVSSVDIPIVIAPTGAVADINVKVRLNHTFDGDVVVDLIAPDGTTVNLVNNRGGAGDNYGTGVNDCSGTPTIFDDAAATSIATGVAPFAGTFKPEGSLATMNGHSLSGTWIFRVTDTAALDTGTVGCVTLDISKQANICCGVAGTPVIASGGPAVITAESVSPANNAPDPGETLTVNLPVINVGDGNTVNLVGTLQTSGGVTPSSGLQTYGVVVAAGPAVSRPFTFVAGGTCGNNITLSLQLQDGALNLGTMTYTMTLGTPGAPVVQTFSNTTSIVIPNGAPTTTSGPASPYPSNITVSGFTGAVTKVTVTFTTMNHTFPDDADLLLVGPTGRKLIVMSDVGGTNDWVNATITLDDAAAATMGDSTNNPSGTYKPTNVGTGDTFVAPAPAGPYLTPAPAGTDTLTSAFAGQDPNGSGASTWWTTRVATWATSTADGR